MAYDKGDLVRVTGKFRDPTTDAPLDPTTVRFKFTKPSGPITTYVLGTDPQLVKDATGDYHVDVDADEVGVWNWRWESTGTGQAAEEGYFTVQVTQF